MPLTLLPAYIAVLVASMHSASACIYLLGTAPNSEVIQHSIYQHPHTLVR